MKLKIGMAAAAALALTLSAPADTITPDSSYLSFADSPFNTMSSDVQIEFWLEDFEDGLLNTLGVSASSGWVASPGSSTDSVDGDDGDIDGAGTHGHSLVINAGESQGTVTFTFDAAALGALPTIAGIVLTDQHLYSGSMLFEAFDGDGNLIDTVQVNLDDGANGTTAEDRFVGIQWGGGIGSITLTQEGGWMELDHLQFGIVVPLPAPLAMGLAGLGLVGLTRSRRRY